ncbi:MAG: GMC family oxidoreductase [Gemmatimonadetes bacterium]|jgi:choline dehydrogenase-like flavoprotein|nr:GMC family oxidoreductase [Gemmatimonadota bacterium]MBP6443221.1 GMC family oxidoreductase [Gemmatimonadales bacterium]MBK7594925.1 GMC family oxidoreductase [Gemmatimonadota bacterium]MBK9550119.1 GMC family oxidoreductase [Gemmatimonadota bacterium]MBP7619619.1 GMC family oxidoreductase [Gemmatimonadales bacterium]
MTFLTRRVVYDAVIVGSGAGGGMAAHELTKAGAKVLLLEAGGMWDNTKDSSMLTQPWETPRRGASTPDRPFGEHDACIGGWNIPGEPFTTAPGTRFNWWRGRMLGGRTNHWGRISLRFGPDDFKGKDKDGLGDNWPISYNDIKPYYDEVDDLVGIFGSKEGLRNHPDGNFLPAPKPRCWETVVKRAADKHKVTCIPSRLSILTKPKNGRPACHYCGQCNRGCATNSNFTSPNVLLFPAMQSGLLTIRTDAMVREVSVNRDGLADGVIFIDKLSGMEEKVEAKVVVLAASACETARIMLNSKSAKFPQGIGNSSGMVGKYLTDTTGTDVGGFVPSLMDMPRHNCDGVGGAHLYMPWWLDNKKLDFPRGYHIEIWGGMGMPGYGFMGGIQNYANGGGYGTALKDEYRKHWGASIGFSGRGEMIPNEKSFCELDPKTVDQWGIPVLRFHWEWSDHELLQVKHMQETFRTLLKEMGAEVRSTMPTKEQGYGIATGGAIIHELGCVRMGDNPTTSAVNANCQAWDCKNLFVADGGPFVSQADKNPTWTILALSMRTSRYIAQQRKEGKL